MESDILIKTVDLSRHYKVGEEEVIALDKVNLEIERNKKPCYKHRQDLSMPEHGFFLLAFDSKQ